MTETEAPMDVDVAPVKDASLTEVLVSTRSAMESAMSTISFLRTEKERITLTYQTVVAGLRVENENLRRGGTVSDMDVSSADDLMTNADLRAKIEAEMMEKQADLKQDLENAQRKIADADDSIAKQTRKAANDAAVIKKLQNQVSELLSIRVSAEARLAAQDSTSLQLVRDAAMNAAERATVAKRGVFLESERARLSAEVVELKSKLGVATAERAASLKSATESLRNLREEVAKERQRGDQFAAEVGICRDEIVALQKARDKERNDALIESKHLNELIALHKEEVKDAEKEAQRYKELLSTVAVDKLEGVGRPDMKTLDKHAEVLLKELQKSLELKLDQIEEQRKLVDRAQDNERQMILSFENQTRECEEAKRMNQELLAEKNIMQTETAELRRKVNRLEERILMAGGLMSTTPELPTRFGNTPNSTSRRMSVTPGRATATGEDNMDIVLQDLMDIKQKNESVMKTLAERVRRRSSAFGTPSDM